MGNLFDFYIKLGFIYFLFSIRLFNPFMPPKGGI